MTVTRGSWVGTEYTKGGLFKRWARIDEPGGRSWKFLTHSLPYSDYVRLELEDITGWYGGVGVRREREDRYGHGTFSGRGWRSERTMTLKAKAICVTPDLRDLVERELSGILWDGLEGTLTVEESNGRELHTTVSLDGTPDIVKLGTTALAVNIPLVSDDPFLYSPWREQTITADGLGVGFRWPPFEEGFADFGDGASGPAPVIWNEGNADSYPEIVVYADDLGGFRTGFDGRAVSYPWPLMHSIPVTVDMQGAMRISGIDQTSRLAEREWSHIPPGGTAVPFLELRQAGIGYAVVRSRDTFI